MKKFKELRESVGVATGLYGKGRVQNSAIDHKLRVHDEQEVLGFKVRSKGERDFVGIHLIKKNPHPVAGDDQFQSDLESQKEKHGNVNDKDVIKPSPTFKELRGGIGKSSYRSIDNKQGDREVVMQGSSRIKEETDIDEAKLAMPLKGHPYHTKSDAELMYIAKDAGEAAKAMKGHNPSAEGKYLDQMNDAHTVMNYRKKGGQKLQKEETDIDEAKLAMPLKGHAYHTKSDAELMYIAKDAGEAAKAMKGHNPSAEGKYLDQMNDAHTVMNYRKKGGQKLQKEEVTSGNMKLNDGSMVSVDPSTARLLTDVFNKLSPENKKKMESETKKDKASFQNMVKFAKSVS